MYLTEKSPSPSFSPFRFVRKRSGPSNFDLIARSIDENVLRRLKVLKSSSNPPSVCLSWLSLAVDFLTETHAEARAVISNLRTSSLAKASAPEDSVTSYLDHSVKLLDVCNSISSEIERLRQRRLLVNFILQILSFTGENCELPTPDKLQRARDSLADWESSSKGGLSKRRGFESRDPQDLIRDLAVGIGSAPIGKISSVEKLIRRTVYSVGLVTVSVAGAVVSALYGLPDMPRIQVPVEFLWADSFNELESAVFEDLKRKLSGGERKSLVVEVDELASRVGETREALSGVSLATDGKDQQTIDHHRAKLENATKSLRTATENLTEGLDRLSNGVNGIFHAVLSTRNGMLEHYRVGQAKKDIK